MSREIKYWSGRLKFCSKSWRNAGPREKRKLLETFEKLVEKYWLISFPDIIAFSVSAWTPLTSATGIADGEGRQSPVDAYKRSPTCERPSSEWRCGRFRKRSRTCAIVFLDEKSAAWSRRIVAAVAMIPRQLRRSNNQIPNIMIVHDRKWIADHI